MRNTVDLQKRYRRNDLRIFQGIEPRTAAAAILDGSRLRVQSGAIVAGPFHVEKEQPWRVTGLRVVGNIAADTRERRVLGDLVKQI